MSEEESSDQKLSQVILLMTKTMFRNALIVDTIFIIIWTVIGSFIPQGNWLTAYNIIMFLISGWWIFTTTYRFFRARMIWKWLSLLLTFTVWLLMVLIIRSLVGLFFE